MITVLLGDNSYQFPNAWTELTADQYLKLMPLLGRFWAGEISLFDLRVEWIRSITGLTNRQIKADRIDLYADNLYTIARQINFFFYIDYDGDIDTLSEVNRNLLKKNPPEDFVSPDSEMRYASLLAYSYKPDAVWAKNLIPTINVADKEISGWEVDVSGGALTSSLTAIQFLQGNDVSAMITKNNDPSNLALLVSILYPDPDRKLKVSDYEALDQYLMQAICMNFNALVSFIFTRTPYSILWAGENRGKESEINTLASESLYSLSKSGFGDYHQIENMPLVTYLSIVRSELISTVKSLYDSKVKVDEIAERTKLPMNLIIKMIS